MPQLKSGRHVGYTVLPYFNALFSESDDAVYFAVVAIRTHLPTVSSLRDNVVIACFDETQGTPPNAPAYDSGWTISDLFEGRSDWFPDEVDEFRHFVEHEPRFGVWLQAWFDKINETIREHPTWGNVITEDSEAPIDGDVAFVKRVIIRKSASQSTALLQLRGLTSAGASDDVVEENPAG